jgi:hypothetical protein
MPPKQSPIQLPANVFAEWRQFKVRLIGATGEPNLSNGDIISALLLTADRHYDETVSNLTKITEGSS